MGSGCSCSVDDTRSVPQTSKDTTSPSSTRDSSFATLFHADTQAAHTSTNTSSMRHPSSKTTRRRGTESPPPHEHRPPLPTTVHNHSMLGNDFPSSHQHQHQRDEGELSPPLPASHQSNSGTLSNTFRRRLLNVSPTIGPESPRNNTQDSTGRSIEVPPSMIIELNMFQPRHMGGETSDGSHNTAATTEDSGSRSPTTTMSRALTPTSGFNDLPRPLDDVNELRASVALYISDTTPAMTPLSHDFGDA